MWRLGEGFTAPPPARFHVVAYDSGIKRNILRQLTAEGCRVTVVPAFASADEVLALAPGRALPGQRAGRSGGRALPGESVRRLVERGLPTFGICLGQQILALALGARTFKLPFGHHGANHPVKDLGTGRVEITSQNHGFAVDPDSGAAARVRGHPRQPQRRHLRGHAPSGAAGVLGPVPPGGGPGAARFALLVPAVRRAAHAVERQVRGCRAISSPIGRPRRPGRSPSGPPSRPSPPAALEAHAVRERVDKRLGLFGERLTGAGEVQFLGSAPPRRVPRAREEAPAGVSIVYGLLE